MFKLAFVGAGRRAQSAHYPTVNRVENSTIEAVAELDEIRMGEVVDDMIYQGLLETIEK